MTLQAKLVVIMDTKRFDGREQREVDYPMHDVLQMLGRASRPGPRARGGRGLHAFAQRLGAVPRSAGRGEPYPNVSKCLPEHVY